MCYFSAMCFVMYNNTADQPATKTIHAPCMIFGGHLIRIHNLCSNIMPHQMFFLASWQIIKINGLFYPSEQTIIQSDRWVYLKDLINNNTGISVF